MRIKFLLALSFFLCQNLNAQNSYNPDQVISNIHFYTEKDVLFKNYRKQNLFLYLYKKFISSQDGQGCAFYPSCSVYSVRSIKRNGILIGILDTFDRLSRCNNPAHHMYPIDNETQLYLDDVE